MVVLRQWPGRSAEADAAGFRRSNALRLQLAYVVSLVLRNERQNLQDNIAEKGSHKVLPAPGVQQRHVNHADVHALVFGQNSPLILDFLIVPAKAVYALDVEKIVFFQFFHQLFVLWPLKILAGLFIHVDIFLRDIDFSQSNQLAVLVLVSGTDADIAISILRNNNSPPLTGS